MTDIELPALGEARLDLGPCYGLSRFKILEFGSQVLGIAVGALNNPEALMIPQVDKRLIRVLANALAAYVVASDKIAPSEGKHRACRNNPKVDKGNHELGAFRHALAIEEISLASSGLISLRIWTKLGWTYSDVRLSMDETSRFAYISRRSSLS